MVLNLVVMPEDEWVIYSGIKELAQESYLGSSHPLQLLRGAISLPCLLALAGDRQSGSLGQWSKLVERTSSSSLTPLNPKYPSYLLRLPGSYSCPYMNLIILLTYTDHRRYFPANDINQTFSHRWTRSWTLFGGNYSSSQWGLRSRSYEIDDCSHGGFWVWGMYLSKFLSAEKILFQTWVLADMSRRGRIHVLSSTHFSVVK